MNIPTKHLRRDTRVFISAVTRELGSVRKLVKKALEDNDYHAVEQDNFPPDYRDLIDKLRARIATCDAVIHIAGHCYGAEPPQRPTDAARRSYTQLEYDLARELDKPVYVFLTGDGFPADPYDAEDEELTRLQEAHRQRLAGAGHDFNPIESREQLDQKMRSLQLKVEALQDELTQVDTRVAATGRRLSRWLALGLVLAVIVLGAVGSIRWLQQQEHERAEVARLAEEAERLAQEQERERQDREREQQVAERRKQDEERKAAEEARQQAQRIVQVEQEFADRFLLQLITNKEISAEDARQRALQELPALVKLPLEEIRVMIDRQIPVASPEAPVSPLDRARTALAQGKLDEVLQAADEQRQEGRELAMLEGSAALAKFRESPKPEWNDRALAAFRRALALSDRTKEPKAWTDAAIAAASLLRDLAKYSEAESLLVDAQQTLEKDQGAESRDVAVVLNNLATLLLHMNRLAEAEPLMRRALALDDESYGGEHPNVAVRLNNLAQLLVTTNRHGEAEPLLRRALAIFDNPLTRDPANAAIVVNNLAQLLSHTNRLAEAEPLMRRVLAIDEKSYGDEHPSVAISLNNLAGLLTTTSRHAEAEPLMRRALVIHEQAYRSDHPDVARDLNNLAVLFKATNRFELAEPLYHRALAIDEQSYGEQHPSVANDLNNLAHLLQDTNRPAEAEPLYRRALAIDEKAYGAEHPKVALVLNNLAMLLYNTNRVAEAEPLMRRALAIDERGYGAEHPEVASVLTNLAPLLYYTNRQANAEPLMRRALAIVEHSYGAEHPEVAIRLNQLAVLLNTTKRVAAAEPLMRRALAIDEQSYGPEHHSVSVKLNNLALLLQDTHRLTEAEPLMRRHVEIFYKFGQNTGYEHPHLQAALVSYRAMLLQMNIAEDKITQRLKDASTAAQPLRPIAPQLGRLLGPARPVAEVLAELDRQYRADGKPAVYFLALDQPMAPHLVELCKPNPDSLNAEGLKAYSNSAYAEAIVQYDEALKLLGDNPGNAATLFTTGMSRAAAMRELGEVEQARDDLRLLLAGLDERDSISALAKGQAYCQLAICQWRLGDIEAARREAERSLQVFGEDAEASWKQQTEQLLADLKDNKQLGPLAKVDTAVALESARARFRAREELATLPLDQPAVPLLDQMLGPAQSTEEVFAALDRQYREQGRPEVWFLPLDEPIAPHLDELLGPVQELPQD